MKTHAIYAGGVIVTDPETDAPVEVQVFKDPESGGMFAVDVAFLDQSKTQVVSPFNKDTILICMEPDHEEGNSEVTTHVQSHADFIPDFLEMRECYPCFMTDDL